MTERFQIDDLLRRAAPYSPRRMPSDEMDALERSLKEFGAVEPAASGTCLIACEQLDRYVLRPRDQCDVVLDCLGATLGATASL